MLFKGKGIKFNQNKKNAMKTLLFTALASGILLSCNIKSDDGFSFNFGSKEGTGIIKNKDYKISFDEIRVAQGISAEVVKSDVEKVVITAPKDILDDILVENTNGKLYIHFKTGSNISAKNVGAKIFAKDFSSVKASSSATITFKDTFTQEKTDIEVSSSGTVKGNLEANDLSIDVSSSGTFSGKIWAVNLESNVSSSGDILLSGKTKNANLQSSSSGTINGKELTAENAEIDASSSGSVSLSVSNELRATANSSGDINIYKKGNLNVVNQKENSGGSVSIN